jgi:hypothetical protein
MTRPPDSKSSSGSVVTACAAQACLAPDSNHLVVDGVIHRVTVQVVEQVGIRLVIDVRIRLGVVEEVTIDRVLDRDKVPTKSIRPAHRTPTLVREVGVELVSVGKSVDILDVSLLLFLGYPKAATFPGDGTSGQKADQCEECESAHFGVTFKRRGEGTFNHSRQHV